MSKINLEIVLNRRHSFNKKDDKIVTFTTASRKTNFRFLFFYSLFFNFYSADKTRTSPQHTC